MSNKQTISKLAVPLVVNDQTAEFTLLKEAFIVDSVSGAEVLSHSSFYNLFGRTREDLLEEYEEEKTALVREETERAERSTADIAEVDKAIADIERTR